MTNEDIEKAAFKFGIENQVAPGLGGELRIGFIAGAEWRINSVWHDTKEKPAERRLCLYILKDGSQGCGYYHKNDNTIFYERFDDVEKWAYFNDLIPTNEEQL